MNYIYVIYSSQSDALLTRTKVASVCVPHGPIAELRKSSSATNYFPCMDVGIPTEVMREARTR